MAKEISPYSIRRTRQARKAQLTVLAEDVESNIQDDLHQYWRIIRKHWGLVLAVPAVFLAFAVLRDAMTIPLYTATCTLLVRNSPPPLLENATVTIVSQAPGADSSSDDQTQLQLLKSANLAPRVVAAGFRWNAHGGSHRRAAQQHQAMAHAPPSGLLDQP